MRKKVDERLRTLIENGVKTHQRSLLVLVGDHGECTGISTAGETRRAKVRFVQARTRWLTSTTS
jgi:hypothetical protein